MTSERAPDHAVSPVSASENNDRKDDRSGGGIGETISVVVQALLIALVFRTFLFQPFSIPTGSMTPTLLIGDYLLVSKFSYGYSNYSLPLSPDVMEGRVFADAPERGDIAVFRLPSNTKVDYIKRVIGLPGDRIQMRGGRLFINGTRSRASPRATISTSRAAAPPSKFRPTPKPCPTASATPRSTFSRTAMATTRRNSSCPRGTTS